MHEHPSNPYASPADPHASPGRRCWRRHVPTKLLLWAIGVFALFVASIVAGVNHYNHLAADYDVRIRDSRVLAEITEPASYWLIPAIGCLAVSLMLFAASLVLFAIKVFRDV